MLALCIAPAVPFFACALMSCAAKRVCGGALAALRTPAAAGAGGKPSLFYVLRGHGKTASTFMMRKPNDSQRLTEGPVPDRLYISKSMFLSSSV